jgi:maltase-glucoamylase
MLGPNVIKAAKYALDIRYEILPYYYTLFYKSHVYGNTVIRPLFHEYPRDKNTYDIDKQFLIGPALLVTPVIEPNKLEVHGYFPEDNWYDYQTGELINANNNVENQGTWITLKANIDYIPLHVRGGYIIIQQQTANTTEFSRKNPFSLIVAPNYENEAMGSLYYDDGSSIDFYEKHYFSTFTLRDNTLKMNIENNQYSGMNKLIMNKIRLLIKIPETQRNLKFIINNKETLEINQISYESHQIILDNLKLPMNMSFELKWTRNNIDHIINPSNKNYPLIDCSIQNPQIKESECLLKGCEYFTRIDDDSPKCIIPKSKGGYSLISSSNDSLSDTYYLKKLANFSLFQESIDNIKIIVSHGAIESSNMNLTRIKVKTNSIKFDFLLSK